ncbi:MAG: 30S ribosomal protein S20 [Patescibacteria group bacterium]
MPVLQSSKKQMRQALKRRERNAPRRNKLKSLLKRQLAYIHAGQIDEAVKYMPEVFSTIDTACKKHLVHPNTAANKKSMLARALNNVQKNGVTKVAVKPGKAKVAKGEKKVAKTEKVEKVEKAEETEKAAE